MVRLAARVAALGYLAALLLVPVALVGYRTFAHGVGPVVAALGSAQAGHAIALSLLVTAISVPVNVVFGVGAGLLLAVGAAQLLELSGWSTCSSTCPSPCLRW